MDTKSKRSEQEVVTDPANSLGFEGNENETGVSGPVAKADSKDEAGTKGVPTAAHSGKAKRTHPFRTWICFVLGISIIGTCIVGALVGLSLANWNWEELKSVFLDYKHTIPFKQQTTVYFYALLSLVDVSDHNNLTEASEVAEVLDYRLVREGENLKYYAVNLDSGIVATNIEEDLCEDLAKAVSEAHSGESTLPLPDGYGYYWYFDGSRTHVIENDKHLDVDRLDSAYHNLLVDVPQYLGGKEKAQSIRAVLAVSDVLIPNPYGESAYYRNQQVFRVIGWAYLVTLCIGVFMLGYSILKYDEKKEFEASLASWLGGFWLEVKIGITILLFVGVLGFAGAILLGTSGPTGVLGVVVSVLCVYAALWWVYVIILDISYNGKQVFANNCIAHFSEWMTLYESKYPWEKLMLKRVYRLIGAEICLAIIAVLSVIILIVAGHGAFGFSVAAICVVLAFYLIYRYVQSFATTVSEMGLLMDQIERMKNGDLDTKLSVNSDSVIYDAVQNLNDLQEGMNLAVSEKLKSERLKIDLITNMSHDLKTPLTSIASYVDLLAKEDLPAHVKDYVSILSQKTERLKNLIQDLFDLSKATSNNLALDIKEIDLCRLIEQTLADMEELIQDSGIPFKVDLPDEPVLMKNDGAKLSRVFQNLLSNAVKYSLPGTRVFVNLQVVDNEAVVTIKNTANYEMNFEEEDILERFARGDASRTTEGSGLGLSIAKSYTEACGGKFAIRIDGDQFTAEVRLPMA
ncbi:MAG TPA: HAMP domain-containing sensor histidine kinase [Bacillota bacterium]|nr:HAMP domain-containing sensor histidine kinase [Bacillota bacterium]